jgi:hypothetical protein
VGHRQDGGTNTLSHVPSYVLSALQHCQRYEAASFECTYDSAKPTREIDYSLTGRYISKSRQIIFGSMNRPSSAANSSAVVTAHRSVEHPSAGAKAGIAIAVLAVFVVIMPEAFLSSNR